MAVLRLDFRRAMDATALRLEIFSGRRSQGCGNPGLWDGTALRLALLCLALIPGVGESRISVGENDLRGFTRSSLYY